MSQRAGRRLWDSPYHVLCIVAQQDGGLAVRLERSRHDGSYLPRKRWGSGLKVVHLQQTLRYFKVQVTRLTETTTQGPEFRYAIALEARDRPKKLLAAHLQALR